MYSLELRVTPPPGTAHGSAAAERVTAGGVCR